MDTENLKTEAQKTMLIEPLMLKEHRHTKFTLVEDANEPDKVIVRGECARAGVPTENKRVYSAKLWEKQIEKIQKLLKERKVLGMGIHPPSGRTDLGEVTHVVTDLYLNEEGILIGEFELIPTSKGRDLIAIIRAGCPIGVSSRGYGSTIRNERGEDVVQEDYVLVTFDFVADPADSNAYPKVISEGKQLFEGKEIEIMSTGTPDIEQEHKLAAMWAQKIKEEAGDEVAPKLSEEDKAELKKQVLDRVEEMKKEIYDQVRKELMADPTVGGAKTAVESIKAALKPFLGESVQPINEEVAALKTQLSEKEAVITALKEDLDSAGALMKQLGFKIVLDETLAEDQDASFIKKAIGDVTAFNTVEDLQARINAVKENLDERRKKERAINEKREQMLAAEREQERQLREQINEYKNAHDKLSEATALLAVELYAEKQLRGHPQADKIMNLIEATGPKTKKEVDRIIEQYDRVPRRSSEQVEQIRAKAANGSKGALSIRAIDEEVVAPKRNRLAMFEEISGTNPDEFKTFAGLGN